MVEDRVSSGRKTFYSLMGSGLHGLNGLPVKTSLRIYNSYVIPRCLYGLESVKITDTAKSKLKTLHRYCLRCILGLPKWSAIPALHILTGQLPIEYVMDIRTLTFIRSLMSIEPTRDIILRQYAIKPSSSNSLTINFKQKLQKYHLPTILDLYEKVPEKQKWKQQVKSSVIKTAVKHLYDEAQEMSSLKFLNHTLIYNMPHPVVLHVSNNRQVTRACIKAMVLIGAYPLQFNRWKMEKANSPACLLCNAELEDTEHFVELCPELQQVRNSYEARIHAILPNPLQMSKTQAILDSRTLIQSHPEMKKREGEVEEVTRDLIFALHIRRSTSLNITSHINYIKNPVPQNPLLSK